MNYNDYQDGMEAEKNRRNEAKEAKKDGSFLIAICIGIPAFITIVYLIVR